FKGRIQEREKLMRFVRDNHKGYFSIQGNPGIGKSALIAQFFKDLRAQEDMTHVQVVEYFIRRGTVQAQTDYMFNYLIRRTDELFAPGKEIRAEGRNVFDLQQQLFGKWRMWGEQRAGKKLLFLIDGLDEGTENNVVTYMPRENFEGVLIIYGSRPGGHKTVEELWTQLPTEYHTKLELAGLGPEDIRALIYEVANKYEVERESAWINAVQQRSQGYPLYLKLLCAALENGGIALNDIDALPREIYDYYKAILDRYAKDTMDGDALLAGLFTFAAARDYLTMAHLGLINKLGDATVQRIRSTLTEVVYENPLTAGVLDYQLFHESFREYLVKEKALKVKDALERIIDFCGTWRELESTWEQRYALQHYAAHAFESKREARATELLALLGDTTYADTQKKVLKQFDATKELFRLCLSKASELKQYNHQLSAALSMVDLKYEEANDAPQVVALVAAGDIDLALKRIQSFGGADKEGVKRRFTLYMLCLMELTLLESKTNPLRKAAIEKLLNHLDEQIPPDTSIINWNDFFPSHTMFLMACEWSALGLDYSLVYKRTNNWDKD
ncbi:MAG: NACHT domain-containing protein, partial [Bacteroidota bacterium]